MKYSMDIIIRTVFRLQEKRWKNVEVGDIVKLQDDDFVPVRI